MTHCYICDKSSISNPNVKVTYHGKRNGKRVQKTIRIYGSCSAWMTDEEIREQVREWEGWD